MSEGPNLTIRRLKNPIDRMGLPELEAALKEIAVQISTHLTKPSASSSEFMNDAIGVLDSISGDTFAEQRIASLFDIAHFFTLQGRRFQVSVLLVRQLALPAQ